MASSSSPPPTCSSSSSADAPASLFESFYLLNYLLPFNPILDAFCPIIYFIILKSSFVWFSHLIFCLPATLVDIGFQS
jgi:hypothetical protein